MRYGNIVVMIALACVAGPVQAAAQTISYTEPHEQGSLIALTQGVWDCGGLVDRDAARLMADMAHDPDRQEALGRSAGCTRTVDLDRIDAPWHVVRRIAALCEERTRETGEIVLAGGRRQNRSYQICGREAHTLQVERDGVRRTVIDVLDMSSYD